MLIFFVEINNFNYEMELFFLLFCRLDIKPKTAPKTDIHFPINLIKGTSQI